MKTQDIFTCLIFITGVTCIENFVEVGKEYEYEYDGRIMSGIPELAPQFAGVYIQAKLILQVYPNNWFHLFVKDVQYKSFNEKFQENGDIYWKNLKLQPNQTMSTESTIEKPIKFTLRDGELSEIIVSENEAEWELNFKKALVSMIKIQERKPTFSRTNSIRREGSGIDEPESTWTVMEQAIDGVCQNRYHYSQVARHLVPDMIETYDLKYNCKNENMYEITKTRDYNSCLNRTAYNVNQHGVYMCRKGTCAPNWQRSALTRYLTCGSDYQTSNLVYIISEGEIQQKLLHNEDNPNFAGTLQTLKFIEQRNSFSELNDIHTPRMIQNILYEYTKLTTKNQGRSERSLEENSMDDTSLLYKNHTRVSPLYRLTPKSLEDKILFDLVEIFKKMNASDWDTDHFVANSLLSTSDLLSLLDVGNLKDLLQKIREDPELRENIDKKKAMEAIYLDTVLMTGTNQALSFLIDIIRSEEISLQQVLFMLVSLPHYMQTPSADIVHKIFQLLKSEVITKNKILKANAIIAFAEILHKACINPKRHQNYPIYILGDFCDDLNQPMNDEYLPYFVDIFKASTDEDMKIATILSINSLAHPSLMTYIEPLLKGQDCSQSHQIMALLSLKPEKYAHPENLKMLLESVIFHSKPVIAMAALMPYFSMNLKVSDLRRLEFLLHFSNDSEISSYLTDILQREYKKIEGSTNKNVFHGFSETGFTEGVEETKDDPLVSYSTEVTKEDNFHSNHMDILYKLYPSKKFHVWMKMFDNLQVFLWPVGGITGDPISYILDTLDLKSHRYGLIKIFDSKPNEVIIPSELGLPYLLEVHSPMVTNLKLDNTGNGIEIKTIQVETGYLGTICPFTRRILAAGVDSQTVQKMHLSINHTLTKSSSGKKSELEFGLLGKLNIANSRKMSYTSAKDLGLLNIVHSVMDKNTLEIQDQFSSQVIANDTVDIMEKHFSKRITFNEGIEEEISQNSSTSTARNLQRHISHHCRTYREHFLLRPSSHQTCFSKARFLKCGAGCAQGDLNWKNIHFICYENTQLDQQATRSMVKAPGISIRTKVQVPGVCRPL